MWNGYYNGNGHAAHIQIPEVCQALRAKAPLDIPLAHCTALVVLYILSDRHLFRDRQQKWLQTLTAYRRISFVPGDHGFPQDPRLRYLVESLGHAAYTPSLLNGSMHDYQGHKVSKDLTLAPW